MESTIFEPVSLGCMPSLEIEMALVEGNSEKVWRLAQSGLAPKAFFDTVRAHVFNMSSQSRKGNVVVANHNSTLFMWPVVLKGGDWDRANQAIAEDDGTCFKDTVNSLSKWMNHIAEVGMLKAPLKYTFIAGQEPADLRKLLNAVVWRHQVGVIGTETVGAQLPTDAPQLVFYAGAMTKRNSWPALPGPSTFKSLELAKRLHSTLAFVLQCSEVNEAEDILVGSPEIAEDALSSGLRLWLDALHEKYEFGQWDAVPSGGDRVDLRIELRKCAHLDACIPLRSYQLGVDGVEQLIAHVARLGCFGSAPTAMEN